MPNAINWFDIPAANFTRAKAFYEAVFQTELFVPDPERPSGMFPADWRKGEVGGAITQGEGFVPSMTGALVFLNGGADLAEPLARVEAAGGKVLMPKTQIPMGDAGFMAMFVDSEGNRIGLHSPG